MREDHKFRIEMREKKFKEQNGICVFCLTPIKGKPSLDHVIPVELGGPIGEESNFVCCCIKCNKNKLSYIVFSNLEDRIIYPIIDVPRFFRASYIQTNKFKEKV